ncbi:MAG: class I SAM-dependent methyltransferase [Patescibacteria group bacterium]|nr:class I SAM-dependent methyltransferase [Patescibacteria group bacterium]
MYYQIFQKFYQQATKRMCQDCQDFIKEGSKILDLGCGSGIVANEFQNFFKAEIVGVDVKDFRISPIPFKVFDGRNLPFNENSFDIVLISYVLHHTQNPGELLREAKRVGKKIIIFEDLPEGILAKTRCYLHQLTYNIFFGKNFQRFNFKNRKGWEKFFKKFGLKIIAQKRTFTNFDFLDPVKRIIFVLKKEGT